MPLILPRRQSIALLLGIPLAATCEAPTAPAAPVCESRGITAEVRSEDLGLAVADAIRIAETLPATTARGSLISRLTELQQVAGASASTLCGSAIRAESALDGLGGDDTTSVEREAIRFVINLARASAAEA
jgi:hypothetical protein